jgi:hypothetical protein
MNQMVDEALLEKVKSLISQRDRIDRELEEIFGGTPRRGRPRKDAAAATGNGANTPVGDDR